MATKAGERAIPWNKGKLLGQKPPLKRKRSGPSEFDCNWIIAPAISRCLISPWTANCAAAISSPSASMMLFKVVGSPHEPLSCRRKRRGRCNSRSPSKQGCGGRIDCRRTSKTGAILDSEPRFSVTSPFDPAVFADCWVVGQFDRFGRSGIRDAFDATYESYDDLSADQKSQSCSVAARAHETRKHS